MNRPGLLRKYGLLFVILIFAFILRSINIKQALDFPAFNLLSDSLQYHLWSLKIIDQSCNLPEVFHQAPFYPYFLALVYRLFGSNLESILRVNLLLGLLSIILIYILTNKLFGKASAVLSAILASGYGVAVFYESMRLTAIPLFFLNLLTITLLIYALEKNSLKLWALSGLTLGLSTLARSTSLIFVPLILIWVYFFQFKKTPLIIKVDKTIKKSKRNFPQSLPVVTRKKISLNLLIFIIVFIVTILPATLRNYIKGNDLVFLASNGGIAFFSGNNPQADGMYVDPPGLDLQTDFTGKRVASLIEDRELKPSEVSNFWLKEATQFIKENPTRFLILLVKKTFIFWNRYEAPNVENYYYHRQFQPILKYLPFGFGFIAPFSLLGIFLCLKKNKITLVPGLFIFSQFFVFIFFFITSRYRLSVCGLLLVYAGFSLNWIITKLKQKNLQKNIIPIIFLLTTFIIVNFPLPFLDIQHRYAMTHVNHGVYYMGINRYDKAQELFEKANELYPDSPEFINNLGTIYYLQNKKEKAFKYYKKAFSLDTTNSKVLRNIAVLLSEKREFKNAKEFIEKSIKFGPYSYSSRINLKYINKMLEIPIKREERLQPEEYFSLADEFYKNLNYKMALKYYEGGLEKQKGSPDVYIKIAEIYFSLGQKEKARDILFKGLDIFPESLKLLDKIGMYYFREKNYKLAVDIFKKSLKINPKHPTAPIRKANLASAYYKMGAVKKAIHYWEECLKVMPDNPTILENLRTAKKNLTRKESASD